VIDPYRDMLRRLLGPTVIPTGNPGEYLDLSNVEWRFLDSRIPRGNIAIPTTEAEQVAELERLLAIPSPIPWSRG